jgi:phage FluMu protein Com
MWRDIRCPNNFKGNRGLGGWCGHLILRISNDSRGSLEHRCPRCKDTRLIRIDTPAAAMLST